MKDNAYKNAKLWAEDGYFDELTRFETVNLGNNEVLERFSGDLSFGTAGLRGIMGAGTNRMNIYTVRKAAFGMGRYLLMQKKQDTKERGVCIAFDTRRNSMSFARQAALVLCALGIKTYVFSQPVPTPVLSYAVREMKTVGGIVITASHNPKEYNGFKAYDRNGCQLLERQAQEISEYINGISDMRKIVPMDMDEALSRGLFEYVPDSITDRFCAEIHKNMPALSREAKADLGVVYTPLHGTGREPVLRVLKEAGFYPKAVQSQCVPDCDFSTVSVPNPEDKNALKEGIALAKDTNADIVIGTDPDCDRVSAAVKTENGYELLSGNQLGALMTHYLICRLPEDKKEKSVLVKTVVTNDMGECIAKKHGVKVINTLTGFKYIGEQMDKIAEAGDSFIFGYEESCGYLALSHTRDKDAVSASLLICCMAAEYRQQGKTLVSVLEELYKEYGYFCDALLSLPAYGQESMTRKLKKTPLPNMQKMLDYSTGIDALPKTDLIKYVFSCGSFLAVRPSGTEPKVKIYISARGNTQKQAESKLNELKDRARAITGV